MGTSNNKDNLSNELENNEIEILEENSEFLLTKKKILIVDDQVINLKILSKFLSLEFEVLEAHDGKQALELLLTNGKSISAVLLDLVMPVLDGYGVLKAMKSNIELSDIPVIVATNSSGDSEIKALEMGASDFVLKPFRPQVIMHRIKNLINLYDVSKKVSIVQHDKLTGLYNKDAFYMLGSQIIEENTELDFHIVVMDVDRFKLINEAFGMYEGDKLLKYISNFLAKASRKTGSICARSNDQFFVLIHSTREYVEKVIQEASKNIAAYSNNRKISVNYGIYSVRDHSIPFASMCDRAIFALQSAKSDYQKTFCYYDSSMLQKMIVEQRIIDEMDVAIETNQFKVYLQPKYDLKTEKIAGAEALVRWIHPEYGFMSPADFIPVFENNGFITKLDEYVWDKTCEIIQGWKESGKPCVPVSVNVSRKDIFNPELVNTILNIVKKHSLTPEYLHLEITESAYTQDTEQLITVVTALKKAGFKIEMDDFGSGYSSLNTLAELPVDILKLDMRFMQMYKKANQTRNIVSLIVSLAKWMNLYITAEGVEEQDQIDFLKELGCNYVQGYYYSKPISSDEFTEKINNDTVVESVNSLSDTNSEESLVIHTSNNQRTMLIVDDMKMNRAILAKYFADSFNIIEAANGKIALDYLKEGHQVSIVMLDLLMPEMNGFDFLTEVNKDENLSKIPIIATSQIGKSYEQKVMELGANAFISKPYNIETALKCVNKVLREDVTQTSEQNSTNLIVQTDSLTGLVDKTSFEFTVESTLINNEIKTGVFILINVDNFKLVNEKIGEENGNTVLKQIAQILLSSCTDYDMVSRVGGDEFGMIIFGDTNVEIIEYKLERILRKLRFSVENTPITCTLGACVFPENGDNYHELYQLADMALLNAKRGGKNQYEIYDKEMVMPSHILLKNLDWILDESSDAIIITDAKTYEMLYINKAGSELANKQKNECFGQTCYQALWGRTAPCEFCANINKIRDKKYFVREIYEKTNDTNFVVKDKLINWGGREARLQYIHKK